MPKTILITGASAGFGAATARMFAKDGWNVIITGRRAEVLHALQQELSPARVHVAVFDVRDSGAVRAAMDALPEDFAPVDVLVNNAGLALGLDLAQDADLEDWDVMVDTNIKGVLNCTHAVLPGMRDRNSGHIVNIGSIAGNYPYKTGNVYGASKAFVKRFSLNLKADLLGTKVRVTNIEPGLARTDFQLTRFRGDEEKGAAPYAGIAPLTAQDIAEAVHWVVGRPAHVTVTSLELWPTDQAPGGFAYDREG